MTDFFTSLWDNHQNILVTLGVAALVLLIFFLFSSLLFRAIWPFLIKKTNEDKYPLVVHMLRGFRHPLSLLLKISGICIAFILIFHQLSFDTWPAFLQTTINNAPANLYTVIRISIVVAIAWGLIASSDISSLILRSAGKHLNVKMGKSLSRFVSAVFTVIVVGIAVMIVLSELEYDVKGIVAGLGLGGLTIALAAQDSAANFFGGMMLVLEKPFEIGDFISCDGVEGTVEDISLRSTKIRTPLGGLTVMPNSNLVDSPLTNTSSAMEKRRADFTLSMPYTTTTNQLKQFTQSVQTMLETNPNISPDTIIVRFTDMNPTSLQVRVIFYSALPDFSDYMRICEQVNFAIMDLAQKHNIDFSLSGRAVYVDANGDD